MERAQNLEITLFLIGEKKNPAFKTKHFHFLSVFAFIGVIMPIICIIICFILIKKAMIAMSQTIDTNLDAEKLKKSFSVCTSKKEEAVTRYLF